MTQQTEPPPSLAHAPVLFVDLDGTLIQTDLVWELLFALLRRQPWSAFLVPFWLLAGRARLKGELASRIGATPAELPYNQGLVELLEKRRAEGTRIVLATASPRPWAEAVAAHLGLFDAVLATDSARDLKGSTKLEAIRAYCAEAGFDRFDYAGNARVDLSIWRESSTAIMVDPVATVGRRLGTLAPGVVVEPVGSPPRPWRGAFQSLRVHQWSKNLLIFVPVITGQRITDPSALLAALAAFGAFCLCASSSYVVNDLVDMAADRAHAEKRHRPFASGALRPSWGPPIAAVLLIMGFGLAAVALPARFLPVLGVSLALTTMYTLIFKSQLMVDVLTLALLYSIRILAGGVATGIPISEWLIGFSMFFFLSLAFVKRHAELHRAIESGRLESIRGRGYRPCDIGLIESLGACSGYLAVVVLAVYIQSDAVRPLYRAPNWLWGISLVLVYWISRIWFLAKRGELPGDPVLFALRDRHSLAAGVIVACCLAAGVWLPWP